MGMKFPRLAARAVILREDRLLLVNAYPDGVSDLWCAPGGGVLAGASLPENLAREVQEETGLVITVGGLIGVNEFHDPACGFHQVDLFFKAEATGEIPAHWKDPEEIVTTHRWVTQREFGALRVKPDMLGSLAFGTPHAARYDPMESIVP